MTTPLFYEEPYRKELNTKVNALDAEWLECEESNFYANSGGQPGDIGILRAGDKEIAVLDTQLGKKPGAIRHQLADADHGLSVGDEVTLVLDWERRHRLMRMHTSLHLLCSLVPKGVTGGSVGEAKSRLDFDLGEHTVNKEELTEKLNALVQEKHPVQTEWITDEELSANPDLVRTMSVQPPRGAGRVRMVKIEGVDYQPCGGTHVANTGEVGAVRVSKLENKGKRNRRIHVVLEG